MCYCLSLIMERKTIKKNKICIENLIRCKGEQIKVGGIKNENVCWNNSLISKMEFQNIFQIIKLISILQGLKKYLI